MSSINLAFSRPGQYRTKKTVKKNEEWKKKIGQVDKMDKDEESTVYN